ncbi:MAG: DUF2125 domain-containing protein [Paracoccaceae bacterium]
MTKKHYNSFMGASAIWLAMTGTALADVTAAEVWDSWKSYAESIGQTITVGSETSIGGTLTLEGVTLAMAFPDGSASGTLELLELRERGDGTVAITMSQDYPLAISVNPPDGEELDMGLVVRQAGMSMIASGGDGTIAYDYSASDMSVDVDKMFVGGQDFAPTISFALTNVGGKYVMTAGDLRQIESMMTADNMTMDVKFDDPNTGAKMDMSGSIGNLSSSSKATLPMVIDMEDPSWVFGGDFAVSGQFASGAADYSMEMNDGTETVAAEGGSASSTLTFALQDGVVSYGGTSTDTEYRVSGSQIPFPQMTLGMAETAFELTMPMKQTEQPTEFGLLTKIVGLSVGDEIWAMLDPAGVLPRDPATAIIDVSGELKWLMDITNPEAMANAQGAAPVELNALTVNDITLSVAGASVEGKGDFTFDPTDTVTFDGMPAPTGEINFTIIGANGLIDKLIQMGLMPEDQAMGARMMLGMFARPADGPDTLSSKIEVKGDGSVFANGQQLQ